MNTVPFARDARVYVAGHRGLVGSAIVRALRAQGFTNLLLATRAELDLREAAEVRAYFAAQRPDHVFLAAARVGGIAANSTYPADFLRGYAQLQVYRQKLKRATGQEDPATADLVEKHTLSHRVALVELVRHNMAKSSDAAKAVESWEAALQPYGYIGIALGLQGKE